MILYILIISIIIYIIFFLNKSVNTTDIEGFSSVNKYVNHIVKFQNDIKRACLNLKISYQSDKDHNIIVYKNGKKLLIKKYMFRDTNKKNEHLANNKFICNTILKSNGIKTPENILFEGVVGKKSILEIVNNIDIAYPLVLKPVGGSFGQGVFTNIINKDVFTKILKYYDKVSYRDKIIVERYVKGKKYRVLSYRDKIIDVIETEPPIVIGNGINSIYELINLKNNNTPNIYPIKINKFSLLKQGHNENSIVDENKIVIVNDIANIVTGSLPIRVPISKIHLSNINMLRRINHILRLNISGIDIISSDLSKPDNIHVIEVNANPGTSGHYFADYKLSILTHAILLKYYFSNK